MGGEIGSVLLIEDSAATLNYNKRLIERNNMSHNIVTTTNGEEALKYILEVETEQFPKLILLDLNMPLLGGFGFLAKYEEEVSEERRSGALVVFLSTSILESDVKRSQDFIDLPLFLTKPLTKEKLNIILEEYNSRSKRS